MTRFAPWLLAVALAASADDAPPRWAFTEGDHSLRSNTRQEVSVTPPGQAAFTVAVETEETWKASMRAAGESWRMELRSESLRVRESGGEWRSVAVEGADEGWAVARLRALRGLRFEMVLAPDGRVRSCVAGRLDVPPPPGLPQDVHDAMWDPTGLAKALRAIWVRLPPALPSRGDLVQVEDAEAGVRRVRTWQRRPEDELGLTPAAQGALALAGRTWGRRAEEVLFTGVFPDGAPPTPQDTIATISPDVVSVTWDEAEEYGVIDLDIATGRVKGSCLQFRAALRIQVRAGDVLETWPGETSIEHVLRLDPPR